jgi:hypothetical protein
MTTDAHETQMCSKDKVRILVISVCNVLLTRCMGSTYFSQELSGHTHMPRV